MLDATHVGVIEEQKESSFIQGGGRNMVFVWYVAVKENSLNLSFLIFKMGGKNL